MELLDPLWRLRGHVKPSRLWGALNSNRKQKESYEENPFLARTEPKHRGGEVHGPPVAWDLPQSPAEERPLSFLETLLEVTGSAPAHVSFRRKENFLDGDRDSSTLDLSP